MLHGSLSTALFVRFTRVARDTANYRSVHMVGSRTVMVAVYRQAEQVLGR